MPASSGQSTTQKRSWLAQNGTKKRRAAILLAENDLTDEAIADTVGIGRRTLATWKKHPEFAALVGDYTGDIIAASLRLPIAKKHRRIAELNDLNERYQRVLAARRDRYRDDDAVPAEAQTGLLVQQQKVSAGGVVVTDWVFDKPLDSAIKETHKQAAQELGQWEETLNLNHGGRVEQEYVIVQDVPWEDTDE